MDQALRAELCASASPGRAREKNAEEERIKKTAGVDAGAEIREEGGGGGEATEASPGRVRGLVLVFVFIRVCVD